MTVTSVLHHCETVGSAERQRMALAQTAERSSRSTCTIRSGTTISATAAIWPDAVVLRAGAVVAAACVALQYVSTHKLRSVICTKPSNVILYYCTTMAMPASYRR
eukprot:13250-Heterococcus_DN1.PRE.3